MLQEVGKAIRELSRSLRDLKANPKIATSFFWLPAGVPNDVLKGGKSITECQWIFKLRIQRKGNECRLPAGVPNDVLQEVGKAITELPKDFAAHRLIKKLYGQRRDMITGDPRKPLVDWGMAEAMAFGTLVSEGAF